MCSNIFLLSIKKFVFHDVGPSSDVGGLVWILQAIVKGPGLLPNALRNERAFAVLAS